MSETPPYASPASGIVRQRLSASSLTSMILGILFCIPLIASFAAIICAIVGFRATRGGAMRGRGFAIAGLVLGIIGMLGWAALGGFIAIIIVGSAAPRAVLHDFAGNIVDGNTAAAFAECDPPITQEQLGTVHDYVVPFGAYSDLTCSSAFLHSGSMGETCELRGYLKFSSGTHAFGAVLVKNAAGTWKVRGFHVY